MNKLGIFMNFWETGWAADHKKYIKKAAVIGFDILEFHAQPLLEKIDPSSPAYDKAKSLMDFLSLIIALDDEQIAAIPPTSIMREFIGGQMLY